LGRSSAFLTLVVDGTIVLPVLAVAVLMNGLDGDVWV
jgi:hypothetical protein